MTRASRVLLVSEDETLRSTVTRFVVSEGHNIDVVNASAEAVPHLCSAERPDLLLLDVVKGTPSGKLFHQDLLASLGSCKVTVLSEIRDNSWLDVAKLWPLAHIIHKPVMRHDIERIIPRFDAPTTSSSAYASHWCAQPGDHFEELERGRFFFASSTSMLNIYKNVRVLAPLDLPVLLLGESGVGKEIIAMLLHKYHSRSEKSFVNVNCAALPADLLESELFGFEAGAFTGAVKAKPGKFELADKGTLLLDEIGEMSPQMQAKLLHVLQDGTFSRLGGRSTTQVDVRVIAATNVDMEAAITEKRFREDLYYRLSAFTIVIPPLRERREELPQLMHHLVHRNAAELGQQPIDLDSSVIAAAQEYCWPGNLRELRNFVVRTLVLQDQQAACNELRMKVRTSTGKASSYPGTQPSPASDPATPARDMRSVVNDAKNQAESRMIQAALTATGWNRRRAATDLKISYRALLYKIQQHGLST